MSINIHINDLINYSLSKKMIQTEDIDYVYNRITNMLSIDSTISTYAFNENIKQLFIILGLILDYSFNIGLFSPNTIKERDLFESYLMDVFSPLPSDLNKTFYHYYNESPSKATDYFYELSKANNYIKLDRVSRNINWKSITKYGNIELTINLSKPEKDPRDIISQSLEESSKYPQCYLCKQNVGFYGNSKSPGRSNHRVVKLLLNNEKFYLQYSPYVYYNEHSIILMEDHVPMKVSNKTFMRLFDFVDMFPTYFLGSNAGLPIVGGSILSHEHYQGGKYNFPIEKAKIHKTYSFGNIKLHNLNWPITVIRVESTKKEEIIEISNKIYNFWENYTNEKLGIYSFSNSQHNAITPIARKNEDNYILDIALRNNMTSKEFPLGVFHTHPENQHIKKENIGLIEVMGLAVLPARLENELKIVKKSLQNNEELPSELEIHNKWFEELKAKYDGEDIDKFVNDQVGLKFTKSLENAAVFKQTKEGFEHLSVFMDELIQNIE